ncbi:Formin-like protein [Dirofilaria immitis]
MLLASQAPVAEPISLIWPHFIIAIFSITTMISLLMLCVSTHCYRNAKKKENPYGEIVTTATADVSTSTATFRNKTDGSLFHYPTHRSCLSLNPHERSVHRLSDLVPHCPSATKRALPKLPELSTQLENKNPAAAYSTIDHPAPVVDGNSSFLYGEGPANPTYESIDMDPLYSKLGNGGPVVKRYDYPIFTPESQPAVTTDDVLYQSASHIYAGVSEDPYSSITSRTGGEMNYDIGYSHVRENVNMESSRSYLANGQVENRTLDHLYSQIRRGPSISRTINSSTYRPLPSNELATEYISSGSDKTNREPSYRYITVRESVDAIRQRLNERNPSSNVPQSVVVDGCGSVREHYYSSIGGSDYETLHISAASANQPCYDSQDVPSTSCVNYDLSHPNIISDEQSKTLSKTIGTENVPPNPPISPIPSRVTAINDNNNLQKSQLSLSGTNMDKAINDSDKCSNISEKIRRLRINFFDQELKLLKDLKGPSSTDLRFGQLVGTIKQHETSKWINPAGANPNLSQEHHIDQTSGSQTSTNFDETSLHLSKFAADKLHIHNACDVTQIVPYSTTNGQEVSHQKQCQNIVQNSRSRSFDEASVFETEESVKEDGTFRQKSSNEEGQCFICHGFDKQAENNNNNNNSASFIEASSNKASNSTEKDTEAQYCSHPRSAEGDDMENSRSVQTSSLNFSHESIDENIRNDEGNNSGVRTVNIDPSWSLISSGENILLYINKTSSKSSEASEINQYNFLKN